MNFFNDQTNVPPLYDLELRNSTDACGYLERPSFTVQLLASAYEKQCSDAGNQS